MHRRSCTQGEAGRRPERSRVAMYTHIRIVEVTIAAMRVPSRITHKRHRQRSPPLTNHSKVRMHGASTHTAQRARTIRIHLLQVCSACSIEPIPMLCTNEPGKHVLRMRTGHDASPGTASRRGSHERRTFVDAAASLHTCSPSLHDM